MTREKSDLQKKTGWRRQRRKIKTVVVQQTTKTMLTRSLMLKICAKQETKRNEPKRGK